MKLAALLSLLALFYGSGCKSGSVSKTTLLSGSEIISHDGKFKSVTYMTPEEYEYLT